MTGQIERMRVFIQVAERASFAAAARHLNISRSIVTRHVAELEAELGVQLLVRTTRSVSLTLAGRLYLERAKAISDDLERTNELVRRQQQSLTGELRVSVPLSLGLRFLPDAVSHFRILYAQVNLKLDLTDRFVDILTENFDMALRISGPPSDKSTIWRKICAVPRVLVAAPAYLQRMGVPGAPEHLADHACLGYSHFAGGRQWNLTNAARGQTASVTVRQPFECNNGDLIAELAARGGGIALLPLFMISERLASGALVPVLDGWAPPETWLTAYYPPYEVLPAKVQAFTNFIEEIVLADPSMLV